MNKIVQEYLKTRIEGLKSRVGYERQSITKLEDVTE